MAIEISAVTARRYVMGRQGLWPGRRWSGLDGAGSAMRAMEDLQLDPLVVVARAHDLALAGRVVDYAIDDWAILTYERREFFEWGGWLAVRPMEELPFFRVIMRRERAQAHWVEVEREHADAIEEMRTLLRSGREVSNRDFAMRDRTRIDDYRGRKDSALALHYLWRVGEAMVVRRERFERVYALTEAVAPAWALREVDEAEAEDALFRKAVAADGLTKLTSIDSFLRRKDRVAALAAWRELRLADGTLVEVRVEGWRATQVALGSDAGVLAELEAGGSRPPGRRSRPRPMRKPRSCRRSTRSARAAGPSRCSASTTSGRSTSRSRSDRSATTRCRSCGATGSWPGSTRSWTARPARSSSTACGWRTPRWRATSPSRMRWPGPWAASSPSSVRAGWISPPCRGRRFGPAPARVAPRSVSAIAAIHGDRVDRALPRTGSLGDRDHSSWAPEPSRPDRRSRGTHRGRIAKGRRAARRPGGGSGRAAGLLRASARLEEFLQQFLHARIVDHGRPPLYDGRR